MTPPPDQVLKFVNEPFFTDEDAEAKAIVVALGMLNHINSERLSPTKKAEVATCGFHPTHWLILGRFGGYAKAEDNGYTVAGFPKSQFSEVEFAAKAAIIAAAMFGSPNSVKVRMVDTKPTS